MTDDLPKFTDAHNYLMSGKTLNKIMDAIRRRTPLDGSCLVESLGPYGFTLKPATPVADFPFKCPPSAGAHSKISGGSVNGTPVTGTDDLSIGDDDAVYIKASLTLTITTAGYVTTMSGVSYEMLSGSSVPSNTSTAAYFQIAQYSAAALFGQYVINSLTFTVDDDGTGTSTPAYFWGSL